MLARRTPLAVKIWFGEMVHGLPFSCFLNLRQGTLLEYKIFFCSPSIQNPLIQEATPCIRCDHVTALANNKPPFPDIFTKHLPRRNGYDFSWLTFEIEISFNRDINNVTVPLSSAPFFR